MRSLDTNILARWILRDDAEQSAVAAECLNQKVYITATVLMELGWLLQSRFGLKRDMVAASLRDIVAMTCVEITGQQRIEWAIDRYEAGADLADVIHVAVSVTASTFTTFDRNIVKHCGKTPPIPIETLF